MASLQRWMPTPRCRCCGPSAKSPALPGTKFGCGMALCGACTVHLDGQAVRSCVTPLSTVAGRRSRPSRALQSTPAKAVQAAWIELQVPQCGYCQSGQIMSATALLEKNPSPTRCRHRQRHERQHLPLRHLFPHSRRHPCGGRRHQGLIHDRRTRPQHRRRRAATFSKAPAPSAAVALTIGFDWAGSARRAIAAAGVRRDVSRPMPFCASASDNSITVIAKHVEMGQGAYTGIATIARRRTRCRLGAGARRKRSRRCEALRQSRLRHHARHRRQLGHGEFLDAAARGRRQGARDAACRGRQGVECARSPN